MSVTLPQGQVRILTAEMLLDLRKSLRSTGCNDLKGRLEPRAPLRVTVDITPWSGAKPVDPFEVWVIDISSSGISFLSRTSLGEATQIMMYLPYEFSNYQSSLAVLCIVANRALLSNGTYRIGCTFG